MNKNFIQPPEIIEISSPVIFLAGPIQDAPDWQGEAYEIINSFDSGIVVASPRKKYKPGEFVYEKQVDWESHFLKTAAFQERSKRFGAVLFWLAKQVSQTIEEGNEFPRSYAQTTRQELGEWRTEKKYHPEMNLVVGIEPGFGNERYIKRRLEQDCPEVPVLEDLVSACEVAIRLVRRKSI